MARMPDREIPTYDPWAPYQIRSHNKKYTGDANGVRFVDGLGVLNALSEDEDAKFAHEAGDCTCAEQKSLANQPAPTFMEKDECQERVEQLLWFYNANPLLKKVAIDPDEPDGESEWRTYTAYLIEPYDGLANRKPRRNQTITARELAAVSAPAGGPVKVKGGA